MQFVKLTDYDGSPLWVNLDLIGRMKRLGDVTDMDYALPALSEGVRPMWERVKETPEEIVALADLAYARSALPAGVVVEMATACETTLGLLESCLRVLAENDLMDEVIGEGEEAEGHGDGLAAVLEHARTVVAIAKAKGMA